MMIMMLMMIMVMLLLLLVMMKAGDDNYDVHFAFILMMILALMCDSDPGF